MNFLITTKEKGIALLISVIMTSVVLTVGLTLSIIVLKEYAFSAAIRESQIAFYTAEAGTQCARYRVSENRTYFNTESVVNCGGSDAEISTENGIHRFRYSPTDSPYFSDILVIDKEEDDLRIEARGYNKSSDDGADVFERFVGTEFSGTCFNPSSSGVGGEGGVEAAGGRLQDLLDNVLGGAYSSINVENDQVNHQLWSLDTETFAIMQVISLTDEDAAYFHNAFGWYVDGNATKTGIVLVAKNHQTDKFSVPYFEPGKSQKFIIPEATNLGFAIMRYQSDQNFPILTTEDAVNPGSGKQAIVFEAPENIGGGYVIGFEDRYTGEEDVDWDYEDMVVHIRVISCNVTPVIK